MAAFDKPCAPSVAGIGDYQLVDSCSIPQPPDPIIVPIDIPIPIPPIDNGCYPLNVVGRFHGPDDPETPEEGSLGVSVAYPTGDPCEPEVILDIFVPCAVTFGSAQANVVFDPELTDTETTISTTADNCDLGFSLHIGIPCPTAIVGATGTVNYDPTLDSGELTVETSNISNTCDIAMALNLVLPCPGSVTATAAIVDDIINSSSSTGLDTCAQIPPGRKPRISIRATKRTPTDSSNLGEGCVTDLDLQLAVPCPIIWRQPDVTITRELTYGEPTATFQVNPGSSSDCAQDCQPKLDLDIVIPCPLRFDIDTSSSNITFGPSNIHPWAEPPTATLQVRFGNVSSSTDECAPIIALDMDLPCPINLKLGDTSSVSNVDVLDVDYFLGPLEENPYPRRRWAFGNPKASLTLEFGANEDGTPTRCVPILDLDMNLPCPTGGIHRPISSSFNDDSLHTFIYERESLILAKRQQDYIDKYGTVDAPKHPYFSLIPKCEIEINQDLGYFATPGNEQFANRALGNVTKLEFNDNCELDFGMSLYIPCGVRSPDIKFYDINQVNEPNPVQLPSTEYRVQIIQDWTDGPNAGDCAFDETVRFFVPRGGGSGGVYAMVAARAGTLPPYRYAAYGAVMDVDGVWTQNQDIEYENVFNIEEQGLGGQYVNPLNIGDVIEVNTNPSGANSYIAKRSHYKGTF